MDNPESANALILSIEIAVAIFAVCLSVSLGFLVAPWLGFMVAAALSLSYAVVMGVSFARTVAKGDEPQS